MRGGGQSGKASQDSKEKWKLAYLLYKESPILGGGNGIVFEHASHSK